MNLVREKLESDIKRLRSGEILSHLMKYYPLAYENISTVFDYIDGTVIFSDYSDILNTAAGIISQYNEDIKMLNGRRSSLQGT